MLFSVKKAQKENNNESTINIWQIKYNFKRIKRKRKTVMFHSYFFELFYFSDFVKFFPCSRRFMATIKIIF